MAGFTKQSVLPYETRSWKIVLQSALLEYPQMLSAPNKSKISKKHWQTSIKC